MDRARPYSPFSTLVLVLLLAFISDARAKETTFGFHGYVKLDVLSSYYLNGTVSPESPLRDFHLPAAIPVSDGAEDHDLDFHAKESRFSFETNTLFDNGRTLKAFFEFDFLLSPGGDERVSNSWNPRLRHVYATYGKWLFGQTWTTFMNVVIPDDLDFAGAAEGIVFIRQPMLRYSTGNWAFAAENPETVVSGYQNNVRSSTESGHLPDLTARYDFRGDWGRLGVSGILRWLDYQDVENDIDDDTLGFGLSTGGEFRVGEHDGIKAQLTAGRGLGRYVALNFVNSAVLNESAELNTIGVICGFLDYRHWWSTAWRTSANVSLFYADNNEALTGGEVNRSAQSVSANLLYSPQPELTFGVEIMWARRELQDRTDGSFFRTQLSARYAFGYVSQP